MTQRFYEDFGRIAQVNWDTERLELQKQYSAVYELFKPNMVQQGNSTQDIFLGSVNYNDTDSNEAFKDSPVIQHPSVSTRQNLNRTSNVSVAVPRKVAQTTGSTVEAKAASYTKLCSAAAARKKEEQLNYLLSASYQTNTIIDGINEQGSSITRAAFPVLQNRVSSVLDRSASEGRLHYLDLMHARQILASAQGKGIGDMGAQPDAARTIDDINYIIYCDNATLYAFIAQNRNTYFNADYNQMMGAFMVDGFKFKSLQDMAVLTTSEAIGRADTFAGSFNAAGVGVSSGGTARTNFASNYRPLYILPRGAFEMQTPSADDFTLAMKEVPTKSYEKILYGECNVYGKRIYDDLVIRYWVDVTNFNVIS